VEDKQVGLGDVEGMPVVLEEDILDILMDGKSYLEGLGGTHTVDARCVVLLDGDHLGDGLQDDGLLDDGLLDDGLQDGGLQDGGLLGGGLLDGDLLVCHLILDRLNLLVLRPK
jgi:hypothetical protein